MNNRHEKGGAFVEIRERLTRLHAEPYPCLHSERGSLRLHRSRMDRRRIPPRSEIVAYWQFIDGLSDAEFADLLVARYREMIPDEGDLYYLENALNAAAASH
ncbi:MAG: hypothetical protein Q7R83_03965 [bacterium]|nr:hypothetical protein [bacterium]